MKYSLMRRSVWSKGTQRSGLQGFQVPACLCASHTSAWLSPVNITSSAIYKLQDDFSSGTQGGLSCSPSGFGPRPCALGGQPCALHCGHQAAALHSSTKCKRDGLREKPPPFPPWRPMGMSLPWDLSGRGHLPSLCTLEPCSAPTPSLAKGDSG